MKLIFLHGAPGSGKLTVAKALLRLVTGRLFDNHAAIDVARTIFDFGAPGFWELVQAVRLLVLDAAARENVPLIVTTFVYVEPDDLPTFQQFESVVQRRDGQLLPVFLQCSEAEITRRIGNVDRSERGKMTSEQGVRDFLTRHKVSPVPRPDCLILNSEIQSAEATAGEIIRHFNLVPSLGS
jgi:hypothetical protein